MSQFAAAVIIPHYNDLHRLERCLAALEPQVMAYPEVEVCVVDNNSPIDMSATIAAFPWARFFIELKKGAAAARNRGVAETTAPALIFLDSDCVPATMWLSTALGVCGPDYVVGGRVDTFDETPAPRSGAEVFEAVFAFDQKGYVAHYGFSVTANLVTSRAVFEATGPMIVGLSEDKDWCQRATAKGFELLYEDALAVEHPTRSDWAALAKKWRRLTEESFALHGTSFLKRVTWALRSIAVAASGLAHMPKILSISGLSMQERLQGITTLLRLRLTRAVWMLGQVISG